MAEFSSATPTTPEAATMRPERGYFTGCALDCGIIPLRPGLSERWRLRRGSTRLGRAARIDLIRANSRKGRGSLAGYEQSPRGA